MIDKYSNLTLIIQTTNLQTLDLKKQNLNLKDREVGTGSYPFQKLWKSILLHVKNIELWGEKIPTFMPI